MERHVMERNFGASGARERDDEQTPQRFMRLDNVLYGGGVLRVQRGHP
jgi:hypothetical protein